MLLRCHLCGGNAESCIHSADYQKVKTLSLLVTDLKKGHQEEAIKLLDELLQLQKKLRFTKICLLETRLRKATILYEHKQFDQAERFLLKELEVKYELSETAYRNAEKQKQVRLKSGHSWPFPEEFPDFERNLYFKRIYSKLRICYERMKRFEEASIFAVLELYATEENKIHGVFSADTPADWKFVKKNLLKCGKMSILPELESIFNSNFLPTPDQDKCRAMLPALKVLLIAPNSDKPVEGSSASSLYVFRCPYCHQRYEGEAVYIGNTIECHNCHRNIILKPEK